MQEQFHIKSQIEIVPQNYILCILAGKGYLAYAISSAENQLAELCWYSTQSNDGAAFDKLLEIHPYLKKTFFKTNICIDNNTNILLPFENHNGDYQALSYLSGANNYDISLQDRIDQCSITNIFSVSYQLYNSIKSVLPQANVNHCKTVLIGSMPESTAKGVLFVNFSNQDFNIVASKENRLLIAQTYSYTSPADVLFYLLKICETFDLKQQDVKVLLSGLIDEDSGLYKDIYQYFLNIEFKNVTWQVPDNTEYPFHLFTILNLLAQCEL